MQTNTPSYLLPGCCIQTFNQNNTNLIEMSISVYSSETNKQVPSPTITPNDDISHRRKGTQNNDVARLGYETGSK